MDIEKEKDSTIKDIEEYVKELDTLQQIIVHSILKLFYIGEMNLNNAKIEMNDKLITAYKTMVDLYNEVKELASQSGVQVSDIDGRISSELDNIEEELTNLAE